MSRWTSGSASKEKTPEIKQNPKTDFQEMDYSQAIKEDERTIKDLEKVKEILIMNKDVSVLNTILSREETNQAGTSTSTQQNKLEKMVEGNADSGEIFKLTDTEENREKVEAVRHEMQETLKTLDEFIKGFESDLTRKDVQQERTKKEWIEKVKYKHELKKSIGEHLKSMYDRVAGTEEHCILPETQQSEKLPVPNENQKQTNKDKASQNL